jgi:uroporphyrinogen decarboxylase
MTSVERVASVMAGRRADRPPVSFWQHFPPDQVFGAAAARAHLQQLELYQLDFLKVMNDNGYPHKHEPIAGVADLKSIGRLRGDEEPFQRQLELLGSLRQALGRRTLMATTLFNAWSILRHLIQPPQQHAPPDLNAAAAAHDAPSLRIKEMFKQDEHAVRDALGRIGQSLANFARRCIEAGADGIFLSVRDDWVAESDMADLYERLVCPSDLQILAAASDGQFNILHVCGRAIDFRAFAAYPVQVLNWADRCAGPGIAQVKDWLGPAICCGVDNLNTLPLGSTGDVEREVVEALRQAGDRPMMISPGCTFDPARVPADNLKAMVQAARRFSGTAA